MSDDLNTLRTEWLRNESELERLRDLPVGDRDPAAREDELEKRQDEIEWRLGLDSQDDAQPSHPKADR